MQTTFDFTIHNKGSVSSRFLQQNIHSFVQAADFIKRLPYKRNANKNDLLTVFDDGHGTCSTKHAILKQLASENNKEDLVLMLGIFKMNGSNTPKIASTLEKHQLDYIPEAHNYFRHRNHILDFTFPHSSGNNFEQDLLEETIISIDQITDFKVAHHQHFLKKWLSENKQLPYSFEEIWKIREECIQQLSKK
jgi:hypothetical protein